MIYLDKEEFGPTDDRRVYVFRETCPKGQGKYQINAVIDDEAYRLAKLTQAGAISLMRQLAAQVGTDYVLAEL